MNKVIILLAFFFYAREAMTQSENNFSDSLNKANARPLESTKQVATSNRYLKTEDEIKAQLIYLALSNPEAIAAEANLRAAQIARRKANSSYLNSVSVSANINEFVINNSPAANFWPKYNIGVAIPLDLFARVKAEKKTADEMITIGSSQKQLVNEALKARVLTEYENFKEKRQLLELQRIIIEDDEAAYEKAQKDFKDDRLSIEEVNKVYRGLLESRGNLASKQKDLNIAVVSIEQIIGVQLKTVLDRP